ncbi:NO signaling/Golgi transport ligand-binding domain-containing protein [Gorgonomyces haynaldii]|nr:NO signaling/Golgi transport ligand-binding domain-containing protein [Gorgonomyces haynaldii]
MFKQSAKNADELFKKGDKIDLELFAMTYGSLVQQLILDHQDPLKVNQKLDQMGYNMGCRLIDDYLSKTGAKCADFKQTGEHVQLAFKVYLNISPSLSMQLDTKEFSLVFEDNPLAEFVELPQHLSGLWYSNIYCGIIRACLEMVHVQVEATFVQDQLQGDPQTEIRVKWIKYLDEQVPQSEE